MQEVISLFGLFFIRLYLIEAYELDKLTPIPWHFRIMIYPIRFSDLTSAVVNSGTGEGGGIEKLVPCFSARRWQNLYKIIVRRLRQGV
jgi:hypothetical protein